MAEKDTSTKTLESFPDVFADIVNGFLFNGEQVLLPEELVPADTYSQYKVDKDIHIQERDVSKIWRNSSINIALIGIENQAAPDRFMPMRVISYDGASYRNQLRKSDGKNKTGLHYPVITLVLYFGSQKWNYATDLHSCLDIPEKLKPFVSNYQMNFFDMSKLVGADTDKFRSDFKNIVDFYATANAGKEYIPSDTSLAHSQEVADFFRVFHGDETFATAYNELRRKESVSMSDLLKYYFGDKLEAGKAEARAEGKAEGLAKGEKKTVEILAGLVRDGILSVSEAAKRIGMSVDEFCKKSKLTPEN